MTEEERQVRAAFEALTLPTAPAPLQHRLARAIADRNAPRPAGWLRTSIVVPATALVVGLVALAVAVGGPKPQPGATAGVSSPRATTSTVVVPTDVASPPLL